MTLLEIFPILRDYSQLIVGLSAAGVALRLGLGQMSIGKTQAATAASAAEIARNKLKFELFEKRLQVYQAVVTRLGRVEKYVRIDREEQAKYEKGVAGARWLFGEEFSKYIQSITDALDKYDSIQSDYLPTMSTNAPKELVEAWAAARTKLFDFKNCVDAKFAEYLELQT